MKRKILTLFIGVTFAVCLTACGNTAESADIVQNENVEEIE